MEPKTLQEAIVYFANPVNCRNYVVVRRWRNGVVCPRCGSDSVIFQEKYNRWQCNKRHDRRQFTVKTGTILEDSPLGLDKWLTAMWMIANCKNGISSWEIHRTIKVTQKTAWFMLQRLRLVLRNDSAAKLGGEGSTVECDETFVGPLPRKMHKDRRERLKAAAAFAGDNPHHVGKTVVMGMLDRDARQVRARVIPNVKRAT